MAKSVQPQKESRFIDLSAMCDDDRERFDTWTAARQARFLGFGNNPRPNFDVPTYNDTKNEEVLQEGNAFIVLGLDRNAGPTSGYGGQNGTHCAAIDLVAGRKAWTACSEVIGETGRCTPNEADADFTLDAARVYISQKSDVDDYFQINEVMKYMRGAQVKGEGFTTWESPRSAVALKADVIRVIARENIKLVTKTDAQNSQGGVLSNGMKTQYGIDLMAMMDHSNLQPMVKGENLRTYLEVLTQTVSQFMSTFSTYVSETRKLHMALIQHTHLSPFYGSPTAPDFQNVLPDGVNCVINNVTNVDVGNMTTQQAFNQLITEYLSQIGVETLDSEKRPKNILSPYNRNN